MPDPRRPDAQRFLDLLEPHQRRLLILSRGLLRRQADADDAVQEAVLKAWRDFPHYRERDRFGTWVLTYLIHTIRNRNRRLDHALEVALPEELEAPETLLSNEAAYESFLRAPESVLESVEKHLADAIRKLPAAERVVLLLRAVGELSYREIAGALRIPEGTAMSHLFRARKHLRLSVSKVAEETGEKELAGEGGGA